MIWRMAEFFWQVEDVITYVTLRPIDRYFSFLKKKKTVGLIATVDEIFTRGQSETKGREEIRFSETRATKREAKVEVNFPNCTHVSLRVRTIRNFFAER